MFQGESPRVPILAGLANSARGIEYDPRLYRPFAGRKLHLLGVLQDDLLGDILRSDAWPVLAARLALALWTGIV